MEFTLKGIELENFKSYNQKQCIQLSDLSVLLGANSSGKSTALQALLMLKQTMECNSPDEELLLSGKFVALGDYGDIISDSSKNSFSIGVMLKNNVESMVEGDCYNIKWTFKRADDGISAMLDCITIEFEDLSLSLSRGEHELFNLLIDNKRSVYSVRIHNLLLENYVLHYDTELNRMGQSLLYEIQQVILSHKTPKAETDEQIVLYSARDFYSRMLDAIHHIVDEYKGNIEIKEFASRIDRLIYRISELESSTNARDDIYMPQELRLMIMSVALGELDSLEELKKIIERYEVLLDEYSKNIPEISERTGVFELGKRFILPPDYDAKNNDSTQIRYALDFYRAFKRDIISNIFFVGPIRETPKGLYSIGFETVPKYVGPTGSYFASVLSHENKTKKYILPSGSSECTLYEALSEWMMHLNVASGVNVDKNNAFGFSVSIRNMEEKFSDIMNVGIGTSQVLPVLISVLLSEPGEILVFEQPELHLHPYSQSRLADLFVEFCKNGRKIILETHSEYFLLRLRYHIVKENYTNELSTVNFFQNMGGTRVWNANISSLGNIDYPDDFRDETQELLNSILEAALDRKGLI